MNNIAIGVIIGLLVSILLNLKTKDHRNVISDYKECMRENIKLRKELIKKDSK